MKTALQWVRLLTAFTVATIAFIVILSESDVLGLGTFFGLKLIGCVVMYLCVMCLMRWHGEGKLPRLWYRYFDYCRREE